MLWLRLLAAEKVVNIFIDGKDKKECHDFWDAYKKYYVMGLTYGIIDGLITVIS